MLISIKYMYLHILKSNLLFLRNYSSVNPLSSSLGGLFTSNTFLKGGLRQTVVEGGGVSSLAKKMASVLHKQLQCKVEKLKYRKF